MGLERIFGDFDARRGNLPTYLLHFKWTFIHVVKEIGGHAPPPFFEQMQIFRVRVSF